jgi:acyl-CoA thioesterase-1
MSYLRILALTILLAGLLRAAEPPANTVVFFGDSLTYGFGLDDPATQSYPALIQKKILAAGSNAKVVNAGLSGDTSAGGLRRVDWILKQPLDIFVLALGANDGLRGIDPAVTEANLNAIIAKVRRKYPDASIILAGMRLPDILGADYVRNYAAVYPRVAAQQRVTFIPFLLEGVGGRSGLNQADSIHPNAQGAAIVADTVWKTLAPIVLSPKITG